MSIIYDIRFQFEIFKGMVIVLSVSMGGKDYDHVKYAILIMYTIMTTILAVYDHLLKIYDLSFESIL